MYEQQLMLFWLNKTLFIRLLFLSLHCKELSTAFASGKSCFQFCKVPASSSPVVTEQHHHNIIWTIKYTTRWKLSWSRNNGLKYSTNSQFTGFSHSSSKPSPLPPLQPLIIWWIRWRTWAEEAVFGLDLCPIHVKHLYLNLKKEKSCLSQPDIHSESF